MSRVIKDGQVGNPLSAPVSRRKHLTDDSIKEHYEHIISSQVVTSAETRAAALLAAAQEKSRGILAAAEEDAGRIAQKAQEEGYAAGFREGEAAAAQLKEEAAQLLQQAREDRESLIASAEPEILALALCLAERILNQELNYEPRRFLSMLKGIKLDNAGSQVTIRANPETIALLKEKKRELQELFPQEGYRLEPDSKVEGGFLLEADRGTVDARVETQLEELAKVLGDVIARG